MSSTLDPNPDQPAAEELVAYLDGELSPDDCRVIEQRLAIDANYRDQLRDLDRAWEALDVLPKSTTGDDFARTTMELVTDAAVAEASLVNQKVSTGKRRRLAWYATAAVAGMVLGFAAAMLFAPDRNQALLRDLPVIRQADVLRQVEHVDFLRRLATEVPAERLMSDEANIEHELEQLKSTTSSSMETRRQWVESLAPDEKVVLAAQADRFYRELGRIPGEQERLRKLESEVAAGGAEIQRTLLAYGQWLNGLTAGKQDELRQQLAERSVDEQVRLVQRLAEEERDDPTLQLSREDAEKLRNELRSLAAERQAELLKDLRHRGDKERLQRLEGPRSALTILARELRNNDRDNPVWRRLVGVLSPEYREHLDSLPPYRRIGQLWRWIGQSLQVKVDADALERFFAEKLDNEKREELLSLPPNEMQARLERLYYATELGFRDAAPWWTEREPGGPMRGDDRANYRGDRPRRDRDGRDGDRRDGPPGGPPPDVRERDRMRPGPGGPPPRDGFPDDDRRPSRRGPQNGPHPPGPPPHRDEAAPQEI